MIADDHTTVRAGLKSILHDLEGNVHLTEASSLEELVPVLEASAADLVLLDVRFGDGVSLDHLKDLRTRFPGLRVLMLSMFREGALVLRALREGAQGFVNKESAGKVLLEAVRSAVAGHVYLDQISLDALARHLANTEREQEVPAGLKTLTVREREVCLLLLKGESVKSIGFQLGISAKTADNHKAAVYAKLNVKGPVELLKFAQENQLV
ncbi:MAG: response regulator transcription factor [Spirochaetales bacterium]